MMLSPHFSYAELTRTNTGIINAPDSDTHRYRLTQLAMNLEHVRKILGGYSLRVTSAYRNEAVNKAVGGSETSDHKKAYAADIMPPNGRTVFWCVDTLHKSWLPFSQLINEQDRGVFHIAFAPPFKREILTAYGRKYVSGNIQEEA